MRALLVNPWVYDFKAFDFWNKPIGLLIVARILKRLDIQIDLIDCMDRQSPFFALRTESDQWGRGKYHDETIEKPNIFRAVPRRYKRYGLPKKTFIQILKNLRPPDIVFVTSSMTYWYPGVFDVIKIIKQTFPHCKVILGGIYATLCTSHARKYSGADVILIGAVDQNLAGLFNSIGLKNDRQWDLSDFLPDYSLYENLEYGVVLTSRGCPFNCTYCATNILCDDFKVIPNELIEKQLSELSKKTKNIAFFDDALLYNTNFRELLMNIDKKEYSLNLHAANGLHCRYITKDIAQLMYKANFKTMYLSLETINPIMQEQTGGKVNTSEFMNAIEILYSVGFTSDQIHTYILYGLHGQDPQDMLDSIELCHRLHVHPHLCEFSPIPHTDEYKKTNFTHHTDPLYHNNLFYTWFYPEPKTELYNRVKKLLSKKI